MATASIPGSPPARAAFPWLCRGAVTALGVVCLWMAPRPGAGQVTPELPIRTEALAHPLAECPAWDPGQIEEPTPRQLAEANALSGAATEAALLGDPIGVRDLLQRATDLNPLSQDLAYRRGRAHEELQETEQAIRWYCRARTLAETEGTASSEVEARLADLQEPLGPPIGKEALDLFNEGVALLEARELSEAAEVFSQALESEDAPADAYYNRGLAYGALRRSDAAVDDFRDYLARRPEAQDRAEVEVAIRFLEAPPVDYSEAGALALGMVLPGAGHFYTDRNLEGAIFLTTAAVAGAAGFLYKQVEILCFSVPSNGQCPDADVVSRDTSRPLLTPALAVVGASAIIGAIRAYRGASARNDAAGRLGITGSVESGLSLGGGVRLVPPALAPSRDGIALELLRLRF